MNELSRMNTMLMLFSVVIMNVLTGMEFDLFVPSFSSLQAHFHLTPFWVESLLSINFIAYGISLFVVGYFSDRYGRKPVILAGLFLFIIGSLCCLTQARFGLMLFGRALQGLGIAAPAILSFLIIADRYPIQKQQFLMAILDGFLNLSAGLAPIIGSYIALYHGWHGNFFALLMLGVLSLLCSIMFVPRDTLSNAKKELDSSPSSYGDVIKFKSVRLFVSYIVAMCVPYWVFVGVSPLLYLKQFHVALSHFGFYQGVLAFVFAIGVTIFGFILRYLSSKKWLLNGIIFLLTSLVMLLYAVFSNSHSPFFITATMLIFVIAQVAPSVIVYPVCVNLIPDAKAKISSLIQVGRLLLSALSLQVVGYFYAGTFQTTGIIIALFIVAIIVLQYRVCHHQALEQTQ